MNNQEIRVIGSNNSNNNAILSMNNYGEYSNYFSRYSNSELQTARNKIYDLLYILYPIYESIKNTNDPIKNFKKKIDSIMDLNSDLIYVLNYFYQEITPAEIPEIPQNELEMISGIITTLIITFNNYIDTEYDRSSTYTNIINTKNELYDELYAFIKLVTENTRFLRDAYYGLHLNGVPEREILRQIYNNNNVRRNQILAQQNIYNQPQLAQYVNNNQNINMNQLQQEYDEQFRNINKNILFNTLNTNNTSLSINNSSPTFATNKLKCTDATMYTNNDIDKLSTKIYIANNKNEIIRIYCIDDDAFDSYFKGSDNIVYECKDSVPNSSLMISENDIIHKPFRRLAFEFNIYVYEKQVKQIQKGKSYILKPTSTILGRIASHSVVMGGTLVGALHCQPTMGNDFVYNISEYNIKNGGYKKKNSKNSKKYKKTAKRRKTGKTIKNKNH